MADHRSYEVRALDVGVGEDDDSPGIGLELTGDDIDDIAYSPEIPLEERLSRLNALKEELIVRRSADLNGDMTELLKQVKDRIKTLKSDSTEGDAILEATAMDTDYRMDDDDPADLIDDEADEIDTDDLQVKEL
jgi:predicted transcriptional regulator